MIDEFCARFVYFYSGYLFASYVFALPDPLAGEAGAGADRIGAVDAHQWRPRDVGRQPLAADLAGARALPGACAIIVMGTLLARMQWLNFLRSCGEHSIVIYLAFFLPMAVTRTLLLKTGVITDIGTISLIVTVAGVAGAVVIWRLALALRADFLFERPAAFWIAPKKAAPRCSRRSRLRSVARMSEAKSGVAPQTAGKVAKPFPHVAALIRATAEPKIWLCGSPKLLPPKAVIPRKNP